MTDVDPGTRDRPSFVRASEHGSDTGTDGYLPQPLDKALLGGAPQRIGTFEYRYDTDTWTWSDTVAQMHGYEPGTVQPTTDLVLSHKHPDDVAKVKGLLKQSSAPFSSRHRITTTDGEIRKVVVVGDAVFEDDQVVGTRGFYIDITDALNADVQDALGEELEAIIAHREIIDEAKGMLMVLYGLNADSAFAILRWRSQELNIKLHTVAAELVDELPALMQIAPDNRRVADHYLMTLNAPE